MKIIQKIISIFKNIFSANKSVKLIDTSHEVLDIPNNEKFLRSLKSNVVTKEKIEILVCVGDGLGIQNKMSY